MDILVVGSGGREHAVIRKLKESKNAGTIYCCPGNGGIAADAACVDVSATDIPGVAALAKEKKVGLVVVTPDDPLVLGMADALEAQGIPAFGPSKRAAAIEGSKVFSKDLMRRYGIPTARYESFDDPARAAAYLRAQNRYPAVIKADGLALGKGVVIAKDENEALEAVRSMMEDKKFGESGSRVVIEEFLEGVEVSVLAFTDSVSVVPMAPSMDHKRALDGDEGPNTGGMGTIAPHPLYTPEVEKRCMEEIFLPTIRAMNAEGRPFQGVLYFGLMLTGRGPVVIEYNCRFGDPETQVVLPLLEGDLLEIMLAVREKRLASVSAGRKEGCAACVVLASGGYPVSYQKGFPIRGLDPDGQVPGAVVYHAGTVRAADGGFLTGGGRVLGVTALGETLPEALDRSYAALRKISFEGAFCRSDIGQKVL
ncbi:MAG TPA: phosphoribosylamine--glycine ligase [Candidatus Fimivivens faecavium]|nr:phosphoribosylamine--glycine ligase [Candidatus Fimivivens faecavium]